MATPSSAASAFETDYAAALTEIMKIKPDVIETAPRPKGFAFINTYNYAQRSTKLEEVFNTKPLIYMFAKHVLLAQTDAVPASITAALAARIKAKSPAASASTTVAANSNSKASNH